MPHATRLSAFRTPSAQHRSLDARLPAGVAVPLIIGMSALGWIAVWQFVEWASWLLA